VANDTFGIIWDASDGRRLHSLTGHAKWVLCAAFSPDGRTLATGGYDKTIRIWDMASGIPKAVWTGHAGGVRSIAFSPGGQTIASGGADNEIRIWDANRGVTTKILKKHSAPVRVLAFSPNGTRLASGSEDRTVQVWNTGESREVGQSIPLPDFVSTLAFSARGQALYAGTLGGHLLNINPENGSTRGYIGVEAGKPAGSPAHVDAIVAIHPSPEGKNLYSVSQDGLALTWPSAGPPQTSHLVFRGHHPMTAVALSPNGTMLATAGLDGMIHLWDAATARELLTLPGHIGGVSSLMFGAGTRLVSAGADERVRVWDLSSGQPIYTVIQHTAELCIALSLDGLTLAIGGRKLAGITLVDLAKGGKPFRFGESAGEITSLAFTPGGERIASGSANGWIRIWSAATGEEIVRGPVGSGSVDGISFNHDSTVAAVVLNGVPRLNAETESGPNHEVVFLDAHNGSVLDHLHPLAHPATITAAAFASAGTVLTAAHDGNLYLWNTKTARVLRIISGHVDSVRGVALVPDGSAVFSAGDRAAKKWPLGVTGEK
jgi:WD40 repeat protein